MQATVAFRSDDGACNREPTCHTDTSAITITADALIETETGAEFSFVVRATASAGPTSLVVKFPPTLEDNALFSIPSDGLVEDDTGQDLDTDQWELEVNYTLTAPGVSGTYTLEVWAAGGGGYGDSTTITVEVAYAGVGPSISDITVDPPTPFDNETVFISANISSPSGITSAILQYRDNSTTEWTNLTMTLVEGYYQAIIPRFPPGVTVQYRIVAVDGDGIETFTDPPFEYTVKAIPIPKLHYGYYLGLPAIVLAYLGTALEYYDEERFTRVHGYMLSIAYFLTLINVLWLFTEDPGAWTALNPTYLINTSEIMLFVHSWHIWLGIFSMIFGTLALISHIAGWKTCNLGLPAVLLWTFLGITGMYLNSVGFLM